MSRLRETLLEKVGGELAEIEKEIEKNLHSEHEIVNRIAAHLIRSGGKRLRPLLFVLSARICDYQGAEARRFSVMFEYLHAASLLHDDLVDGADVRRGRETAHMIWGNSMAVLVGDFLLARALNLGTSTGKLRVIETIAEITEFMAEGEVQQLFRKGSPDLTEAEYMDLIQRKTGALMKAPCVVGAVVSDADAEKMEALGGYGMDLGIAFQMADDLLDYTSDSEVLGKPVGADIREGKMTLPLIHAMENAEAGDRSEMERIITCDDFDKSEFTRFRDMLEAYGGIEYTFRKAAEYAESAKAAISIFEPSETRGILELLADYASARES